MKRFVGETFWHMSVTDLTVTLANFPPLIYTHPLSSGSSEWTAERHLFQVEVAHIHPLVEFEVIDQTVTATQLSTS
jgi:hypothetical protein